VDFFELIERRHSVRAFHATPVQAEALERILRACDIAPSAGNLQAYEIYVVEESGRRAALAKAAFDQDFIKQAPVALVFCTHPARAKRYGERGASLYAVQDVTIAAAYAQLAAVSLGLASCWVGAFDEAKAAAALELPAGQRPIVILPIGFPAETPATNPRRGVADLVHRG